MRSKNDHGSALNEHAKFFHQTVPWAAIDFNGGGTIIMRRRKKRNTVVAFAASLLGFAAWPPKKLVLPLSYSHSTEWGVNL